MRAAWDQVLPATKKMPVAEKYVYCLKHEHPGRSQKRVKPLGADYVNTVVAC